MFKMNKIARCLKAALIIYMFGVGAALIFFALGGSSGGLVIGVMVIYAALSLQAAVVSFKVDIVVALFTLIFLCLLGFSLYFTLLLGGQFAAGQGIEGGWVMKWVS